MKGTIGDGEKWLFSCPLRKTNDRLTTDQQRYNNAKTSIILLSWQPKQRCSGGFFMHLIYMLQFAPAAGR